MTSLSDGLGPQKHPNSGRTRVESGPAGTHRPTTRRGSAIGAETRLLEDELGVLMPTTGERHHEDPGAAHAAVLGIEELAGVVEVHLRFFSRPDFESQRGAAA